MAGKEIGVRAGRIGQANGRQGNWGARGESGASEFWASELGIGWVRGIGGHELDRTATVSSPFPAKTTGRGTSRRIRRNPAVRTLIPLSVIPPPAIPLPPKTSARKFPCPSLADLRRRTPCPCADARRRGLQPPPIRKQAPDGSSATTEPRGSFACRHSSGRVESRYGQVV